MTIKNQSTALVPTPKLHAPAIRKSSHVANVKLVDDKTILENFPVSSVVVTAEKPGALRGSQSVGITIERS